MLLSTQPKPTKSIELTVSAIKATRKDHNTDTYTICQFTKLYSVEVLGQQEWLPLTKVQKTAAAPSKTLIIKLAFKLP